MPYFTPFPKISYNFGGATGKVPITDIYRYVAAAPAILDDISYYQYYTIRNGERPDVVSQLLYGTPEYYWTFFMVNDSLKNGLVEWPRDSLTLNSYLASEYSGTALVTLPYYDQYNPGLTFNSLAGKFSIGERVTGSLSGASGTIRSIDIQLSQLILVDVTGVFNTKRDAEETISGTGGGSVKLFSSHAEIDATHHYEDANGLVVFSEYGINPNNYQRPSVPDDNISSVGMPRPVTNLEYELALNEQRSQIRVIQPNAIYKFVQDFEQKVKA